jgi:hypothetical protein
MGSIGIISLTTRRNRRFFISAEHYPVVKVRPTEVDLRRSMRTSVVAQRSAGRWPAGGRQDTDQGLDDGPAVADPFVVASGGPEIFGLAAPAPQGGGDEETRTPDPLLAKETLCQLSYVPRPGDGGRFWTRTRDLCLIRAVL